MIELLNQAGFFGYLCLFVGTLGGALAIGTLVLTLTKSKAASVTGVVCLLLALGILGLGLLGHSIGINSLNGVLGNVPDEMKDKLLHQGTQEARANFAIALIFAALPTVAGALAVTVRRLTVGIALAVLAAASCAAMLFALTRPLPSKEPKVAIVPGLELAPSISPRPLATWALIALTPDGLWVDGAKAASLRKALSHQLVRERNTSSLPVLVDRRTTFQELVELLRGAYSAGWYRVELVVQGPDGAHHVIALVAGPKEETEKSPHLTLLITRDELQLGSTEGALPPIPRDWHALNDKLAEIKVAFPDERTLRVTALPETSTADLVAALDAARGRDERLLFDELIVGQFRLPSEAAGASGRAQ